MEISKHIIEKCKKNDRKAQQVLYTIFASKMYGVCLRYYPNMEIARDILQDGFIKVFQNIKSFRGEGSFEGWMRRVMVNTALEYHRKTKETIQIVDENRSNHPSGNSFINYDYQLLLTLVSSLPKQYRLVFNLYAIEGYTHKEIAALLDITESTSKSNYSRARSILRDRIRLLEEHENATILRTGSF